MFGSKLTSGKIRLDVLLGYFISYVIIITVLFVVIGGYSYINIMKGRHDAIRAELGYAVQRSTDNLDSNLSRAISVSMSFYNNREVERLRKMNGKFAPREYIGFQELSRELYNYTANGTFIKRIGLYFHNSQAFIASDMVESRPDVYYAINFAGASRPYNQWRETLVDEGNRFYVPEIASDGNLSLYYRLPFADTAKGVTAITDLRVGDLLGGSGLVQSYKNAALIITDSHGKILYTSGVLDRYILDAIKFAPKSSFLKANGVNYEWYTEESGIIDWKIHFLVDQHELYNGGMNIKRSLIVVYFIVLTVAMVLAVMFSRNISDPIASLLRLFEKDEEQSRRSSDNTIWRIVRGDELRSLWQRVFDMSENQRQLIGTVKDYKDASRGIFYNKLLGGEAISSEEVEFASRAESLFDYTYFTVAVARFLVIDEACHQETDMALSAAMEALKPYEAKGVLLHKVSYDHIAVIICGHEPQEREYILSIIEPMSRDMYRISKANIRWGIGDTVRNSDQIFVSYQNASHSLYSTDILDKEVFSWYSSGENKRIKIDYGMDDEHKLLNALSRGDGDTAKTIIRGIVERNADILRAYRSQRSRFVSAFSETARRLEAQIADIGAEREKELELYLWQMMNVKTPEIIMNYMFMVTDIFTSTIVTRNEHRCQKLMARITGYIEDNFGDPNLCLASIAHSLRLTESYISTFFKQNSGCNISQYIEKMRMSHASKLLAETCISSAKVAEESGYNNMNTFYKAFKRYHGMTPKAYKEKRLEDTNTNRP